MSNSKTDPAKIKRWSDNAEQWRRAADRHKHAEDHHRAYLCYMFAFDNYLAAGLPTLAAECKKKANLSLSRAEKAEIEALATARQLPRDLEKEIINLRYQGFNPGQIAYRLHIGTELVKAHIFEYEQAEKENA